MARETDGGADGGETGTGTGAAMEVPQPIINGPFDEPTRHWHLRHGEPGELREGRQQARYFVREPGAEMRGAGREVKLALVNTIRGRMAAWRAQDCPGASRTTRELMAHWRRDGRRQRLFFAQLEAAETVIFLTEARADLLQGIEVPADPPTERQRREDGFPGFVRRALKMATGTGKTTVMGMLAAWSILNKTAARNDGRFSDAVVVVVPNVTIRNRCAELDPNLGEASLYRTRDLVPDHLMPRMQQGRVLIRNWHVFQRLETAGGARVRKTGVELRTRTSVKISDAKTKTGRGIRYLTKAEFDRQVAAGLIRPVRGTEVFDRAGGSLKGVDIEAVRHVESETAWVRRVLGRDLGGKRNLLVMNDEAHHAYRVPEESPEEGDLLGDAAGADDEEDDEEGFANRKEATVWVEGLDLVAKHRGVNFCVDLSATPCFLGRMGERANLPFPWIVSDFGLVEAIESGLVKVPQLATRDTSGKEVPGYFNIWAWVLNHLSGAERGGSRGAPKPEAVLKLVHTPLAIMGDDWQRTADAWTGEGGDARPPVFIVVVKNTKIAKALFDWLGEGAEIAGAPSANLPGFRNAKGATVTIRVDSKVVSDTDTGTSNSDGNTWMRHTLDTVGRAEWPKDRQGRPIMPEGFEALAKKLDRPMNPPGRDIRCIVSVGMLTEGWDCNTVTHIVGMRPFQSQLLCEQVVGRGLRRASYETGDDGLMTEEVAKVFGVPFEIVPFKADDSAPPPPKPKKHHVHAEPSRAHLEIKFPRVEGYTQAVRNRVTVDWSAQATLVIDPVHIPPEVEMKASLPGPDGRPNLSGPGDSERMDLSGFRAGRRMQELVFHLAARMTKDWIGKRGCPLPAHVLFPQMAAIVDRFIAEKVEARSPATKLDLFLSPHYGYALEQLLQAVKPDPAAGDPPEIPRYEERRGPGTTADVDYWTSKDVREVTKSHVNFVVADTKRWEQQAAYFLDTHWKVEAFVKNAGLGFAIPYMHGGNWHDYVPDFIVRLAGDPAAPARHLILEVKGFDEKAEVKKDAASRWVKAVNADGKHGTWRYAMVRQPSETAAAVEGALRAND